MPLEQLIQLINPVSRTHKQAGTIRFYLLNIFGFKLINEINSQVWRSRALKSLSLNKKELV